MSIDKLLFIRGIAKQNTLLVNPNGPDSDLIVGYHPQPEQVLL
jgi:hypothetical protein